MDVTGEGGEKMEISIVSPGIGRGWGENGDKYCVPGIAK